MTILYSFNPRTMADDISMTSLGLEEYPAIKPDGTPFGDPHFRTSGGKIIHNAFSGVICPPRLVKRLGSPIIRGETRMALDDAISILFSADARQCIRINRQYYGTTHALVIDHMIDNANQRVAGFFYQATYDGITNVNNVVTLPSEVDVAWVVDDDDLIILVNGVQQRIRDFTVGGYRDSLPIPASLIDSNGAGWAPYFTNNYAFPLVLRDNADLIYCTDAVPRRYDDETSRLVVRGTCTKPAATSVAVVVRNDEGTQLFSGLAPILADKSWQIATGQIPKAYEPVTFVCNTTNGDDDIVVTEVRFGTILEGHVLLGAGAAANAKIEAQLSGTAGGPGTYRMTSNATSTGNGRVFTGTSELRITATNSGGGPEQRVVLAGVQRTLIKQPVSLGLNLDLLSYYGGWWPFNDIGKAINWRSSNHYYLPPWADPDLFTALNGFTNFLPASTVDFADNGSPRKFPDNLSYSVEAQLPRFVEPGDYVMDMTDAPNLAWSFANTAGKVTVTLDHYGSKLHRVSISEKYIPTSTGDGFRINLTRDNAKANKGMPTTAWNLSMTKVGSSPDNVWNESFLDWLRQGAMSHIRWMTGMMAAEPARLPRDITTAAIRNRITDQTWANSYNARPQIPFELIVDLHNRVDKHIWLNFPRTADESYIRAIAALIRDDLDPSLKLIWTMSNEVWNFSQQQVFGYRADGLARGLGKGRTCTADIVDGSTTITLSTAQYGPVEVGQRITGPGIPDDTFIDSFGTGTGRVGTYVMSNAATATLTIEATYDAAVFGGDDDYDYSAVPNWTTGMSVTAGDLVQSYNIYRARTTHTSTSDPNSNTDWTKWDLVQGADLAGRRAHIEQILAVEAIMIDEMGGDYADRCQLVVESWESTFERWIPVYLDWGNLREHIVAICGAAYFGNETPIFRWSSASAAVRQATENLTGEARIAVWIEAAKQEGLNKAARHARNAGALVAALEARGMAEGDIGYWTYEGGPEYNFGFANTDLATTGDGPIDQTALRADILAFHAAYHEDIVRTFYEAIFDVCGGTKTHFDSFTPTYNAYQTNTTSYLFWGISRDVYDRAETSSKYRALRDLSIEHGDGEIEDPPPNRQRRRQTMVLS